MHKKICVFLSLCLVIGLGLSGCAKDADKKEKDVAKPIQTDIGTNGKEQTEKEQTEKEPATDAITSLPVVTTKRNIPEGSNVIEVDGKWIVAANIDTDYYSDSSWRDMTFFVLSREPMDTKEIHLQTDVEEAGLYYKVYEDTDRMETFRGRFSALEYFAYHGVDWKVYMKWEEHRSERIMGNAVENEEMYVELDKWEDEFERLSDDAIPQFYAYMINFAFTNREADVALNTLTISWPGVEVPIEFGEIRLHSKCIYDEFWENPGIEKIWGGANGSPSWMFGPELACSHFVWKATEEISIKNVYCLDENYEVVGVTVKGTSPGMDDIVSLKEDRPIIVSQGTEFETRIFFTGPHLSELNVMGQGYFVIEYECGGIPCKALWEGGPQRQCESMVACMMLFDNVDWQGLYELFYYNPEKDNGESGNPDVYDKIGWTQIWQERYGEK